MYSVTSISQDNVTTEVVNDVTKDSSNDVTNRLANMERQLENLVLLFVTELTNRIVHNIIIYLINQEACG